MNRRCCPGCLDRYPLQNGMHTGPNGEQFPCVQPAPLTFPDHACFPVWPAWFSAYTMEDCYEG